MKTTPIDSAVLGGQGSIGSYGLTVPNPAPVNAGPQGGGTDGDLSIQVASPDAETVTHKPDQGIYDAPGGPHIIETQYTTIGPVPEG